MLKSKSANSCQQEQTMIAGLEREIIALKEDFTSTGDALCEGTGYGSKWTGSSSLPQSLTFAQVAQVWQEANGGGESNPECQAAVVLSASESTANAAGNGVN